MKFVIPPQFDINHSFQEGLAIIRLDKQYGCIDRSGEIVFMMDPQIRWADYSFHDGMVKVKQQGKYGFLNRQGEMVIPARYEEAFYFERGLARVGQIGQLGLIDTTGKIITPPLYSRIGRFFEGLAIARPKAGLESGYLNERGEMVIPPRFWRAEPFYEGLAAVCVETQKSDSNLQWGYIDKSGNWAIEPHFEKADDFSEGLAPVKQKGRWHYINTQGEIVFSLPKELEGHLFECGLAKVYNGIFYGFVNRSGETVIRCKYRNTFPFSEGLAFVCLVNHECGYINTTGEVVIPPIYEHHCDDDSRNFSEGLALVEQQGRYGYINRQGEVVIPIEFDYGSRFTQGLAPVKQGGKGGYLAP